MCRLLKIVHQDNEMTIFISNTERNFTWETQADLAEADGK